MTIIELFALEPRLRTIAETVEVERASADNPWMLYERAKRAAVEYIGYDAEEKALRLPAAYDCFCHHITDLLSL